jgi:hypothetical protein
MESEMLSYRDRARRTHFMPPDVKIAECHQCGAACAHDVRDLPRIAWSLSELAGYVPCKAVRGHMRPICDKCARLAARGKRR